MTTLNAAAEPAAGRAPQTLVNDFVIDIATANGSGSQSANLILSRTIFNMGVPVGCKNLFPSNIQGLPTWFNVRVNKDGWTARRRDVDIFVCMNKDTIKDDLSKAEPNAVVIVRDDLVTMIERTDLRVIAVPFGKLVVPVCPLARLRKMVINIMYTGVLAYLLDLDLEVMTKCIEEQFHGKKSAIEINQTAAKAAYDWAKEHLAETNIGMTVKPMDRTQGKILIEGNAATAIGAMFGGVTVVAWYPITPSSSVAESLSDLLKEFRHEPETGKATYAIVQAEDELAAMAMAVGAGWCGARSMTGTSGPGISLMAELAGLCYFAEIPVVIIDVQRMGPSTGLPTRNCAGDILKAYNLSHGDCKHPLLIPGNMAECFEFACDAFNYAERYQTLVFVMTDLDLGMNIWMSDPFAMPERPIDRGKVLDAEGLEKVADWGRYKDVDKDGIPWRTLPGTPHPRAAFFTRGTGHTDKATYSEKPHDWKNNMDRLSRKFETIRQELPAPILKKADGAVAGIIAYGSADLPVLEALDSLAAQGIALDYMRVRAFPPSDAVLDFIAGHERVYVVDLNRDAQALQILRAEGFELRGMPCSNLVSIRHYDGMPLDARSVVEAVESHEATLPQGSRS